PDRAQLDPAPGLGPDPLEDGVGLGVTGVGAAVRAQDDAVDGAVGVGLGGHLVAEAEAGLEVGVAADRERIERGHDCSAVGGRSAVGWTATRAWLSNVTSATRSSGRSSAASSASARLTRPKRSSGAIEPDVSTTNVRRNGLRARASTARARTLMRTTSKLAPS